MASQARPDFQLWIALFNHRRPVHRIGTKADRKSGYVTLAALDIPLVNAHAAERCRQIAPRVGFAYSPGSKGTTVIRGGFGLYFSDLAQNGWVTSFQAVDTPPGPCVDPVSNPAGAENVGCVAGDSSGGTADLIDPRYRTPYAIHISAGAQHAFTENWALSADFIHEQGNHGYRAYSYTGGTNLFTPELALSDPLQSAYVPDVMSADSDNRSSYNGLLIHLQGKRGRRAI